MGFQVRLGCNAENVVGFRWESELCASFLASVQPALWSRHRGGNWLIIEESNCSDGRADQVWARIEPGWTCEAIMQNASLLLNPTLSRVLSALRSRRRLAEEALRGLLGISASALRKAMRALLEASLVVLIERKLYQLANHVRFPKIEICSFEMKLDNWKRALYQSTRYRSFSHRVFVVMPDHAPKAAKEHIASFAKIGIGLMTHGANGTTKVLVRPAKSKPRSDFQSMMALGMLLSRGACLRLAD